MLTAGAANKYDNPDTLFVARDGTAEFRNITEAIEVCRAFMEYHKVIFVKNGTYKEKIIMPQWLQHIEICGEDRDQTIITYDDHANIAMDGRLWPAQISEQLMAMGNRPKLGTFRSFTVRVDANDITFKNITIENNAARLGQAVAVHTQGDRIQFVNCRLLGNQDTVYTGMPNTRIYFLDCYIEGTTDFIFGPSIAWFQDCTIHSKKNSYVTAASTLKGQKYGYVFKNCRLTAAEGIDKCYLGRPWGAYAKTVFIDCELGAHILPEGWHDWERPGKPDSKKNSFYAEYGSTGPGAVGKASSGKSGSSASRVKWSHSLSASLAALYTPEKVFSRRDLPDRDGKNKPFAKDWNPIE